MKKIFAMLLALIMMLSLAACGSAGNNSDANANTDGDEGDKIVIGVSLHDLTSDGYAANLIGIKDLAASKGNVEIKAVSAEGSAETQISQIEDFITSGVDGIILLPVDSSALAGKVKEAVDAGIPVVCMDRSVDGDIATCTIESDNYQHGVESADLMLAAAEAQGMKAEDLKVLELLGAQSTSAGLERHEGFAGRCEELGITIVSALPTEWGNEVAYKAMHSGVSAALDQLGKYVAVGEDGHIIITSVDGDPNGIEAVKAGYIDAMAEQGLLIMGSEALETVLSAINGDAIADTHIQLSPVAVTKDNADSDELWPNKIK